MKSHTTKQTQPQKISIFILGEFKSALGSFLTSRRAIFCITVMHIMCYPPTAAANRCRYDPASCDTYSSAAGFDIFGWIFGLLAFIWVNGVALAIGIYVSPKVFKSETGGALVLGVLVGYAISVGCFLLLLENFSMGEIVFGMIALAAIVFFKVRSGSR
jgi:hypothetical protein